MATRIIASSVDGFIRCVTTDPKNLPRQDEFEVEVESDFTLADGPWKWDPDQKGKVKPTAKEIEAHDETPATKASVDLALAVIQVEADLTAKAIPSVQALIDAAKARG